MAASAEDPLQAISIHAPHAGSDVIHPGDVIKLLYFNPRSPCGERPARRGSTLHSIDFNPRSPCGERQQKVTKRCLLTASALLFHTKVQYSKYAFDEIFLYICIFICTFLVRTCLQFSVRFRFASNREQTLRIIRCFCAKMIDF